MKRTISVLLTISLVFSLFVFAAHAENNGQNLLVNGGFEDELLGSGDNWDFKHSNGWYVGVNGGTGVISTDEHRSEISSLKLSNATAGQLVTLTSGCKYSMTVYVKGSAGASAKINIDDGTADYPDSGSAILKTEEISVTADWQKITLEYTCTLSGSYVICLETWDGSTVYFDDVILTMTEYESGGITNGDFSAGTDGWTVTGGNTAVNEGMLTISGNDYDTKIKQTVTGLENGTYNLSVSAKTGDIDGIAYVYAKTAGHTMASTSIPQTAAAGNVLVPNIVVENGECEIGIYAKGNATITAYNFSFEKSENTSVDFLKGGEISKLTYVEDQGGKFYRADGTEADALQIMAENGFNLARIRILNDPGAGHGNGTYYLPEGYMTETDCLSMARRAKDKGMQILFTFAYSDFWSDGGEQFIPHEWQEYITEHNLTGEGLYSYLENKTYEFTKDIMEKLIEQGTCPEYVSIGNEMQYGLYFGKYQDNSPMYNNSVLLSRFLNAGAKAVRETSADTKIVLHSDNGGKLSKRGTFTETLSKVDFDVIAVSYYPYYNADVSIDTVVNEFNSLIRNYNKDVLIMETGYNWSELRGDGYEGQLKDSGYYQNIYGETKEGQRAFLTELYSKLKQVAGGRCIGDLYWDPIMLYDGGKYKIGWAQAEDGGWTQGNVISNSNLFDFESKALKGQLAMKYNTNATDNIAVTGKVTNKHGVVANEIVTLKADGKEYQAYTDAYGDYFISLPYPQNQKMEIALADRMAEKINTPDYGILLKADFGPEYISEHEGEFSQEGRLTYTIGYPDDGINKPFVALYDSNGALVGIHKAEQDPMERPIEVKHKGTYTLKAFMWDNNYKPVCRTAEKQITYN